MIYWSKNQSKTLFTATEKESGFKFTIMPAINGFGWNVNVRGLLFHTGKDFNETWNFKTVGACKSFITRHFG